MPVFMACMPMAPSVPITVETAVATTATSSVMRSAAMICLLVNSLAYQSSVKPVHSARETELLKDSAIMITMGMYRKASTSAR